MKVYEGGNTKTLCTGLSVAREREVCVWGGGGGAEGRCLKGVIIFSENLKKKYYERPTVAVWVCF